MGIIGRIFGRKGGEEPEEPREEPGEEAAAPAPEPAGEAPQEEASEPERKPGFLDRVKRVFRRKKEPGPAEETSAPGEAKPAPPPTQPVPTGTQEALPGTEDLAPEAAAEPEEKDYSNAPSSITVQIPGTWKMSRKKWVGVVKGTLTGNDVVEFLKHLDKGEEEAAVMMVCQAFDQGSGFADAVDLGESEWGSISY
ncbi:hypothetical protein OG906_43480 (plasmid) [Streptomyces sp. NBC_01426]|uniref:hypothetical protein n=1 Tax=Streptomyces sp. NBC_01426 TaxID=2975866 RepID=UPI002E31FAD4|nr:hypothetical protein [Streptomyces sp. NBC_01426]